MEVEERAVATSADANEVTIATMIVIEITGGWERDEERKEKVVEGLAQLSLG